MDRNAKFSESADRGPDMDILSGGPGWTEHPTVDGHSGYSLWECRPVHAALLQ
jgi:hypothetical protein